MKGILSKLEMQLDSRRYQLERVNRKEVNCVQEIQLTPKELVCVASILGAKEFFGIPDPFFGMDRGEIAACVNTIQSDLKKKGILDMDFSGAIRVCEPVADLVKKCAFCDAYALGTFQAESGLESLVVYFKDQEMILLTSMGSTLYVRPAEMKEVLSHITGILGEAIISPKTAPSKGKSSFTYQTMERLRKLAISGDDAAAKKEMITAGFNEAISNVFLGGFHSDAKLYTMVVTNFAADQVDLLLCIDCHGSLVCIERNRNANSDEWIAEEVSGKELVQYLEDLLERTRCT